MSVEDLGVCATTDTEPVGSDGCWARWGLWGTRKVYRGSLSVAVAWQGVWICQGMYTEV